MNLHPFTLLLLLILAFFFYAEGQVFFFFTTLAIGFLLFVVSLSTPGAASHSEKHGSSLYPEKMQIKIEGSHPEDETGQKEIGEGVAGVIDFTGNVVGKFFNFFESHKDKK